MKRRTIVTATSFVLLVLLATGVSTGAHAQSRVGVRAISTQRDSRGTAGVLRKSAHAATTLRTSLNASTGGSRRPQGLVGPRGPRGPVGPDGPTGVTGPTGAAGAAGAPGTVGAPGQPGATGPTGPAGPAGPTGTAGPQGVAGSTGYVGVPAPVLGLTANWLSNNTPLVSSNAPGTSTQSSGNLAIDDDFTTGWASAIDDPHPTITLKGSSTSPITGVQLYWGDHSPRTFHIEICADIPAVMSNTTPPTVVTPAEYCEPTGNQARAPWTPVGTGYTNDTNMGNLVAFSPRSTQYIRLVGMNTTNVSYLLNEFEIVPISWGG